MPLLSLNLLDLFLDLGFFFLDFFFSSLRLERMSLFIDFYDLLRPTEFVMIVLDCYSLSMLDVICMCSCLAIGLPLLGVFISEALIDLLRCGVLSPLLKLSPPTLILVLGIFSGLSSSVSSIRGDNADFD